MTAVRAPVPRSAAIRPRLAAPARVPSRERVVRLAGTTLDSGENLHTRAAEVPRAPFPAPAAAAASGRDRCACAVRRQRRGPRRGLAGVPCRELAPSQERALRSLMSHSGDVTRIPVPSRDSTPCALTVQAGQGLEPRPSLGRGRTRPRVSSGSRVRTAYLNAGRGHPRLDPSGSYTLSRLGAAHRHRRTSRRLPPTGGWRTGSLVGCLLRGRHFSRSVDRALGRPPCGLRRRGRQTLLHGLSAAPARSSSRRLRPGAPRTVTRTARASAASRLSMRLLLLAVSGLQPPWYDAPVDASPRCP